MTLKEISFRPRLAQNAGFAGIILIASTAITLIPGLAPGLPPAFAQGSPVPGAGGSYSNSYGAANSAGNNSNYGGVQGHPAAAAPPSYSAPVPGASHAQPAAGAAPGPSAATGPGSKYRDLPLTADSAKYRLEELRALLSVSRPQDVQSSIQELCEWLNDAADAHYRMYMSFAKSDLTRSQANSEKSLNQRFGQLKREAQLLRADLLIKQLRAPEALAPLVDIVVADPRSGTGQQAYKRLVDLGFSQGVPQADKEGATALAPAAAPHDVKTQANSKPPRLH